MTENVKHVEAKFADWLANQMPPNTVISDAGWWAPRILREIERLQREAAGGGEGVAEQIRACFDGIDLTRHQFNVGGIITRAEDGCGEFYKASAINEAIERINELMRSLRSTAPRPTGTDYSQCCDTPAYCASVRRCTAKDTTPASAEPGEAMDALRGMWRALVDAGGATTVARHGVERGGVEWAHTVTMGMLAIERMLHPERFDDFPSGNEARGGGEAVCFRMRGSNARWTEWLAMPVANYERECIAKHGWEIEYAYTHPTPAALDAVDGHG
jgi:hypothetical protein